MKYRVYPYKQGSASAKALAEALEGKVLKHVGSKYKPRAGDIVVNWGSSTPPVLAPATTLNRDVRVAQCKKQTLILLDDVGVKVPDFVVPGNNRFDKRDSKDAAAELGFPVVCRTKLNGHSGEGIVIANNKDELVDAPLYTKYIKKKDEYRVHVFRDDAFFIQRKARKLDVEEPNWQVRNLAGGFVFVEADKADVPEEVVSSASESITALGLDFGGVDVIWNEKEQQAYVLEVNTACGLEERTANLYAEAIHSFQNERG